MIEYDVTIKTAGWREGYKLLEALTSSFLLHPDRITWEEDMQDNVILHCKGTEKDMSRWVRLGFSVDVRENDHGQS